MRARAKGESDAASRQVHCEIIGCGVSSTSDGASERRKWVEWMRQIRRSWRQSKQATHKQLQPRAGVDDDTQKLREDGSQTSFVVFVVDDVRRRRREGLEARRKGDRL